MWNQRDVLDSLLWEAAHDDMGIYSRAVVQDGIETPRSEYGNGWNAALFEMMEKHAQFTAWAKALTPEQRVLSAEMLDADDQPLLLHCRKGEVGIHLQCGDTFMYACSDSEDVDLADLPDVHRLWKAHSYYGIVAWIAKKRGDEPVKEYRYNPRYLAAKADV